MDSDRRIHPRQSRPRTHRPRKSQLNPGHTTSYPPQSRVADSPGLLNGGPGSCLGPKRRARRLLTPSTAENETAGNETYRTGARRRKRSSERKSPGKTPGSIPGSSTRKMQGRVRRITEPGPFGPVTVTAGPEVARSSLTRCRCGPRTTPLSHVPHPQGYVVAASKAGRPDPSGLVP